MEIDTGLHGTSALQLNFAINDPAGLASFTHDTADVLGNQLSYYPAEDEPGGVGWYSADEQGPEGQFDPAAPQATGSNEALRRTRACESCRGLKVRCDFPPEASKCKRCARAKEGRECIVTVPTRKRQRRTDPKVADLERKIDDLTATVEEQQRQLDASRDGNREAREGGGDTEMESPYQGEPRVKRRKPSNYSEPQSPFSSGNAQQSLPNMPGPLPSANSARVGNEYADVIDKGILSSEQAEAIYEHYRIHMEKHLPCVVVSTDMTFGIIRKTKPMLFLAILSVASGQVLPELQRRLSRAAMKAVADLAICRADKSLELVQALQILTIWHTSEDSRDTTTFQLVNLAYSTAISLDLAGTQSRTSLPIGLANHSRPGSANGDDKTGARRAWLACFLLGGICSLPMRQQNLIRWSASLDDTVQQLCKQEESIETDKVLCKWVEVQRVSDRLSEISNSLAGNDVSRATLKRELQALIGKLQRFNEEVDGVTEISLRLLVLEAAAYARMVAMRIGEDEHHKRALKANGATASKPSAPSDTQVAAIRACARSIHAMLEEFCAFLSRGETIELNALPAFHFSRIAYCLVALICLHFGATGPDSKTTAVLSAAELRVGDFLSRLLELLRSTGSDDMRRPAQKFQLLVKMLRAWFERSRGGRPVPGVADATQVAVLQVCPVDLGFEASPRPVYRKMSVQDESDSMTLDEDELMSPPAPRRTPNSTSPVRRLAGSRGPSRQNSQPHLHAKPTLHQSMLPPEPTRRRSSESARNARGPPQQHGGPGQLGAPHMALPQHVAAQAEMAMALPPAHATSWPLAVQAEVAVADTGGGWFGPASAAAAAQYEAAFPQNQMHEAYGLQQWPAPGALDPALEQAVNMALGGGDAPMLGFCMDDFFAGIGGQVPGQGDGFGGWYGS